MRPTGAIDSTDAEHLLWALKTRLPLMPRFSRGARFALVLNCDTARSNTRLARRTMALAETEPFVLALE
eukprot:7342304-Lingulodinium_polyedra.AAC.1